MKLLFGKSILNKEVFSFQGGEMEGFHGSAFFLFFSFLVILHS